MMKKILLACIILTSFLSASAVAQEKKHVLRIGAGVHMLSGTSLEEYQFAGCNYVVWPALFNEYQYNFTPYFSLAASLSLTGGKDGIKQNSFMLRYLINPVFTPFPKQFRWIKFSCGIGGSYVSYTSEQNLITKAYWHKEYHDLTAAPSIRGYFIDNDRFELSLAGTITLDYSPKFHQLFYNTQIALYWGVKF